jgi:hypothetical protein
LLVSFGTPEGWELDFLRITGRLFECPAEATNFLACTGAFFLGGEGLGVRISNPGVTVLPEDGMSPSIYCSSSDSWGEIKRAVGRGPVVDGPLGFFKMG